MELLKKIRYFASNQKIKPGWGIMEQIVYITDPKVLAIPIIECNDPLLDIKDFSELCYGEPPECELTKSCYTHLRKSVIEKLCQAQMDLPKTWRFRLYEGFRSLKVQQILFDQEFERVKTRNPKDSYENHFTETTRLVSPVTNIDGSANIPAHNTGGAVDIEIMNADGQLVEMGMTAKDWCCVDPDLCLTHSSLINENARKNRLLLLEVMQAHEFINYPTEWWHFSYGDRYWAYHQPIKQAIFGSADVLYGSNFRLRSREETYNYFTG